MGILNKFILTIFLALIIVPFGTVTWADGGPGGLTPQAATLQLIDTINGMSLPHGVGASLDAKLESVINSLNAGNNNAADNQLGAFINEVNAQDGKKLTVDQASSLIAEAQIIISKIS